MALLTILRYPDPRLHTVAQARWPRSTTASASLVDDMLETMYAADGVGLAATQVDVHERVIVIDTSDSRDQPLVLINPEIVARSDEMVVDRRRLPVGAGDLRQGARAMRASPCARSTATARPSSSRPTGLTAVCVQHEMDHLLGKVFVEYLSPLKRDRIRTRMLKKARDEERRAPEPAAAAQCAWPSPARRSSPRRAARPACGRASTIAAGADPARPACRPRPEAAGVAGQAVGAGAGPAGGRSRAACGWTASSPTTPRGPRRAGRGARPTCWWWPPTA